MQPEFARGRRGLRGSVRALITGFLGAVLLTGVLSTACTASSVAEVDRTSTLQAQLDALQPGGSLKLDPGVYAHSGVIEIRVPNVQIDGNGATLRATNDETSAVRIDADGVQLSNLTLAAPTDGRRWSGPDQHKLVVAGQRTTVSHVSINGSAAAGIFVTGAGDFRIDDVSVTGTRADGIHVTGGSHNGVITGVRTDRTGDDGVAVVSYRSDGASCADIEMSRINVGSTRWGRGISVVGGRGISVRGFNVANTNAAGIYIATEGNPYFTNSTESVDVSGGSVTNANTNPDVVQGAVLVSSGNANESVRDVAVSGVTISGTPASAQRDVGVVATGSVTAVSLSDIAIRNTTVTPFDSNAPAGSFFTSGWTVDGSPVDVT